MEFESKYYEFNPNVPSEYPLLFCCCVIITDCIFFVCLLFPRELNKLLKPDKQRANELRVEFQKGFYGIARRIWPHLAYVHGVVSGEFSSQYCRMFRKYQLKLLTLVKF